jgi:hypothetical protein
VDHAVPGISWPWPRDAPVPGGAIIVRMALSEARIAARIGIGQPTR